MSHDLFLGLVVLFSLEHEWSFNLRGAWRTPFTHATHLGCPSSACLSLEKARKRGHAFESDHCLKNQKQHQDTGEC